MKIAELREVLLQLLGQIDSPARLKNPDCVPGLESEGLNRAFPVAGEILTGECPRWIAGRRYVAPAAEKLLEARGANLQRDRTMLAPPTMANDSSRNKLNRREVLDFSRRSRNTPTRNRRPTTSPTAS